MKRIHLILSAILIACMAISCDDNSDNIKGDSDIVQPSEPQLTDVVSTTINRTAYLVDGITVDKSEKTLLDNFIARYANSAAYGTNHQLRQGDAIVFSAASLHRLIADDNLADLKRDYSSGAVLLMHGGSASDFAQLCDALGCFNPYGEESGNGVENGYEPLWVLVGNIPGASGIYTCLNAYAMPASSITMTDGSEESLPDTDLPTLPDVITPTSSSPISDYAQGKLCDTVVGAIKQSLEEKPTKNDETSELTELMSAVKVFVQNNSWWEYKGQRRTRYCLTELDIWNAYSVAEKRQYYYIHQEMTYAFSESCVGSFHDAQWKSYGMYGKYYETCFKNENSPQDVILHRSSPSTTQTSTTYTSSISYNIGGEISTAATGLSGGVNISNTQSYVVEDVMVYNNCVATTPLSKAAWKFDLRDAKGHFNWKSHASVDIDPCSASGRSTFTCGADYIFSVPNSCPNSWIFDFSVTSRLVSCYNVFGGKVKTKYHDFTYTINYKFSLPKVATS